MRKSVKMLSAVLAVCMTASVFSMSAAAEQKNQPGQAGTSYEKEIMVTPTTEIRLNPYISAELFPWPAYCGYGYWKIFISNYSANEAIKIRITKGSPTGQQVGAILVAKAGQRVPFYCGENSPLETDAYYLSVYTSGEHNLNGRVFYKFASTYKDLF